MIHMWFIYDHLYTTREFWRHYPPLLQIVSFLIVDIFLTIIDSIIFPPQPYLYEDNLADGNDEVGRQNMKNVCAMTYFFIFKVHHSRSNGI